MASLTFPSSPSNGDTYTYDGLIYVYNSTKNKWSVQSTTTITDVQADSISTSLSPSANVTYDLGTSEKSFRDLYLSGSTIYLGSQQISSNSTGVILPEGSLVGTSEIGSGSGVTVYANASILPTSGLTAGELAFTGNAMFITTGSGWYRIAVVNQDPTITLSESSITLGGSGNTVFFTYTTSDPDGTTPTVTLANSGIANTSVANVNLYTANNTVRVDNFSATDWSGTITLTASDGISTGFDSLTVSVEYVSQYWDETALSIGTSSTNSLDNDTFIDRSDNNRGVTVLSGTPHQSAFHPYLDNWSNKFDGNDQISFADVSSLDLDTGDFTIEGWWYFTDTNNQAMVSKYTSGNGYVIQYHSPNLRLVLGLGGSDAVYNFAWTATQNTWYHVAITRSGTDAKAFINGVQIGSTTTVSTSNSNASATLQIGSTHTTSEYTRGHASNIRIVKGTALYTANFTPPTEKLTAVSGTSLLTCQSNRFVDNSSHIHTVTIGGNPEVSAYNPFGQESEYATGANKGSVYFDGTSDYLDVDASTDIGTGDFTVQGWIYDQRAVTNERQIISNRGDGGGLYLGLTSTSELYPYIGGSFATSGAGIQANAWQHFALCRTSGTLETYVNGVRYRSDNQGSDFFGTTGWLIGGGDVGQFKGWIADLRVATVADYTGASYTIPTSPTGSTNADLYLTGDNAGIYDKTGNHTLTLNGNIATSTTQTKFATTSMAFDGSGDWCTVSLDAFPTVFTVEMWLRFNSVPGSGVGLLDGQSSGLLNMYWDGGSYSTNVLTISNRSTNQAQFSWVPSANQWYHLALVRESDNTMTAYVDGTSIGSTSNGTSYGGGTYSIGGDAGNNWSLNGYIENFQIFHGIAKYTTNFTPPTQTQGRTYQVSS